MIYLAYFPIKAVQSAPVYYVTGNHEASMSEYDKLKTSLEMFGVVVLEDKAIPLENDDEKITLTFYWRVDCPFSI